MTCGRDGCTGTIVDGYCDVCGMAAGPEPCAVRGHGVDPHRLAPRLGLRRSADEPHVGQVRGGLGAGLVDVPTVPYRDPSAAIMARIRRSSRTGASARAAASRSAAGATAPPGARRGLLPQVRRAVLLHAEARRGRRRRRPVRGRRVPRARRDGLDLPGARSQRVRPLGRAQGPAQHRRRRRDGGRARRAALPGRGRAPEHRQDLQLRPARALGLHRHGVRRRARA